MTNNWPPQLSEAQRNELLVLATSYALANGLCYLPKPESGLIDPQSAPALAVHAPFTLLPSVIPRKLLLQAQRLQHHYHILYTRIALDYEFLDRVMGAVQGVGKVDTFTGDLWKGWKSIRDADQGYDQTPQLGLFRSDYLLHLPSAGELTNATIKQVEFNTISVSFGALSEKTAALHRYLHSETGFYGYHSEIGPTSFPPNEPVVGLASGLAIAHQAFGNPKAAILFVIQRGERNVFDQRPLEYQLHHEHNCVVIRQTFDELRTTAQVSKSGQLAIHLPTRSDPLEISVVYYRAGYAPNDYQSDDDYQTRFKLEKSNAIQCPSIPLQLAGGKKVQQVLTDPGVLERFLQGNADETEWFEDVDLTELRGTWMDMWGLDEIDGLKRALEGHDHLVLKPQREGGGNNVYTSHIPDFLKTLPEEEREAWIAMEMIQPPRNVKSWMVKAGEAKAVEHDVVSELGIFGWALFGKGRPTVETGAGWLVRTKGRESDEGGVAVGFSVLDSIIHLDNQ